MRIIFPAQRALKHKKGRCRIVHVIGSLVHGGAESVIFMICSRIRHIDPSIEFRVCALCETSRFAEAFAEAEVEVDCLNCNPRKPLRTLLKTIGYFKKNRPDIVHTHLAYGDRFGLPAAFLAGIGARICTLHNLKQNRTIYERFTNRLTGVLARKIVAVSDSMRKIWVERRGMPQAKTVTIKNAASFEAPQGRKAKRIASGKPLRCACIGNIRPVKGHAIAIEAIARVGKKIPAVTLDIYGSDPDGYAAVLQKQIDEKGLRETVRLKGPVTSALPVLKKCDIIIIPSLSEGFSIVAVEAMSMGVPVVASDIPVHREILGDGEPGVCFVSGSAAGLAREITALASDSRRYHELSRQGLLRAGDFSQQTLAQSYRDLYKSIARKP